MKNTYITPAIEFNAVETNDIMTNSLTNGGDEGSVFATRNWSDLDFH